jgi:hypothetical protein
MAGFYDSRGNFIEGATVGGGRVSPPDTAELEAEVTAAVLRCSQGASARDAMAYFYRTYPHLREDLWEIGEDPLSPLMDYYVKETLGL